MTTTINNEHKKLNVPNLRFKEFQGEWEICKLGDIASNISSGKSKSSCGNYNLYGSTGIIGKTCEAFYEGQMVLVARVGANAGKLQLINEKCGITDNTLIIKTEKVSSLYIYYYLQYFNLNRLIFGSGQPLITGGMLKKVVIHLGGDTERKKIAKLMSLLDERIATQSKVIEDLKKLKRAIIETEYNGKGQECRIGDIIKQTSQRNKDNLVKTVLSVNNKMGFINQDEQFEDRTVASEDTSNYKVVTKDDFAYNPARINVGSIACLKSFDKGIVSPMYICFKVIDGIVPEYLESYFATNQFFKEMQKRLEGSVRLCLSFEGLCNIPIAIPNMDEQGKTGKRINLLESKIDTECNILSQYEEQKQYLLHQMFI